MRGLSDYKGLYSLPVPGMDIGLSEAYGSLRDYDNAIVVNSEYYGVSVSKLMLVEDDFGAGRGILLSKESSEIKDSDSGIWLDPKRSDVAPDDREIICIFSHTAIPDNYYWSKHGPFKKEFDESLDCLSRLFNAIGPHFSAVFSDLEDAYMNMPIKDTYEPGVYKTRKSNSLVVKMRFMPSVCWSFYGRKLTSEFCSFPQLVHYIGKDEFPLEAVAES